MKNLSKIVFLISHIPNPRILKRVKILEEDFDITLIYWDRGQPVKEEFEINPINTVIRINISAPLGKPMKRIIPLMKFIFDALRQLKYEKPNIIHVANIDMLFIAVLYKKNIDKNIRIIYEVADLPKYSFYTDVNSVKALISKILQTLEKKLTSNISKLILTSPYFWDEYYSKFVSKDKYLFIPNAPFKSLFDKYKGKRVSGDFTIGFIGSVRYIKQLKMLIDAVDEINEEYNKNIKVFIAGSGPGYEEIIEYSINKTFVEIYGPYNYEKEIISLYEKVDCVYSVYDTKLHNVRIALPNRLYESIVCSIPIIGAKGTVLAKFIEDNKIGFTVDAYDKEELKRELINIVNNKGLINLYKDNCDRIKYNFYYENNSEKLLYEYKKIIQINGN